MNWKELFESVKSDFFGLMNFKIRGNTIEVQTNLITIGNQFVSVFISTQQDTFIVSDGGWIDLDYYGEVDRDQTEDETLQRIEDQLRANYNIKTVKGHIGNIYNFKTTSNKELLSLVVLEMANFVAQFANARLLVYGEEKLPAERQMFVNEVNSTLKAEYGHHLTANDSLGSYLGELGGIRFNSIIRKPKQTSLLMYVGGTTSSHFLKSATLATVNFRIANRDRTAANFKKIAIFNSNASGYNPERVNEYLKELRGETSIDLLDFYRDQNRLPELIAA